MTEVLIDSSALINIVDTTVRGDIHCFPLKARVEVASDIRVLDRIVCTSDRKERHECSTEERISITSTHVDMDRIWAGRVSRI